MEAAAKVVASRVVEGTAVVKVAALLAAVAKAVAVPLRAAPLLQMLPSVPLSLEQRRRAKW